MKTIAARPIETVEAAVVRSALRKAPVGQPPQSMIEEIDSLKVIGVCECGCRSIYFAPIEGSDNRVADGVGYLADGERIDVLVWASDGHVTALELVDHGGRGQLPAADSICTFEEAGAREART